MNIPPHLQLNLTPQANPDAIVTGPDVRFTVLTECLLRLEYCPDGRFEDRASQAFWFRAQPVPVFETRLADGVIEIETAQLLLRCDTNQPGFSSETLSITLKDTDVVWRPGLEDPDNLRGTYRTVDAVNGCVPLEPGLVSRSGWALVDDSGSLVFNDASWLEGRDAAPGAQDLYFFGYGSDYQGCLRDYARLTGNVPLIPRWILGNWWSRYHAYEQSELLALMDDFKAHEVPLSVCIVDMDWHITETGNTSRGWTGYTFNPAYFPNPQRFFDEIHARGLKTALNLHPDSGVHPHEEQYPAMARRIGIDPASKEPVRFDIANPAFTMPYLELLHHPYEAMGVDFWWMDWQQGEESTLPGLDPLWMLNHVHFHDDGRDGVKRPFIFSRWGGLGNHRYPIGFSGDSVSSWASLAFQPYYTATAANVGYSWWSHDIGGHYRDVPDPELQTRWAQFGVFSPIMRLHSTKGTFYERRPWAHGSADAFQAIRDVMQLRHALIPYIYTAAWRNATETLPLVRPMYWDYPNAEEAYACPQQYMFGSELIVAPYTAPADPDVGLARQVVWLPEGDWYHFFTGEHFTGGAWHAVYGDLYDIPVFARAGAIVPLGPRVGWGGVENPAALDVHIFAGADGAYTLYEDDGATVAYRDGAACQTAFSQTWQDDGLTVQIAPVTGDASVIPAVRSVRLFIHGISDPETVSMQIDADEHSCTFHYDAAAEMLAIETVDVPTAAGLTLHVAGRGLLSQRDRTPETLFNLAQHFQLDARIANGLVEHMDAWIDDPVWLGATFGHVLSAGQARALLETITGAGFHRVQDAGQAELVVLWNNRQHDDVTFRYVPPDMVLFWCFQPHPEPDHGVVPRFRAVRPVLSMRQEGFLGRTFSPDEWQVRLDYAQQFVISTGAERG